MMLYVISIQKNMNTQFILPEGKKDEKASGEELIAFEEEDMGKF